MAFSDYGVHARIKMGKEAHLSAVIAGGKIRTHKKGNGTTTEMGHEQSWGLGVCIIMGKGGLDISLSLYKDVSKCTVSRQSANMSRIFDYLIEM